MKNNLKKVIQLGIGVVFLYACSNEVEEAVISNEQIGSPEQICYKIKLEEAQVDLESLLADLENRTSRVNGKIQRKIKNAYSLPVNDVSTRSGSNDSALIHIFNFEDDGGYAIMSGDVRVPTLIALAERGSINIDEEIDNPGVALFLEGMNELYSENTIYPIDTIVYEFPGGPPLYPIIPQYGEWENIVYKDGGWCPVKWGQDNPYNMLCPLNSQGESKTGCVATAVAQLMSIYQYPPSYDQYSFNWTQMTNYEFAYKCSSIGKENIARLMQQLGLKRNLDMEYGFEESGTQAGHSIRTLENFGYSCGGVHNDYNSSAVISELKQGYSVFISGFSNKKVTKFLGINISTTYNGGHQWLAHGLLERRREVKYYQNGKYLYSGTQSICYPLYNWGWDGASDGYYLSDAFDAKPGPEYPEDMVSSRSTQENNYQYKVTAITGIRK